MKKYKQMLSKYGLKYKTCEKPNIKWINKYPIEYTGEDCPKCGRLRVELYNNGERICEKCNWNIDKQEYEPIDI